VPHSYLNDVDVELNRRDRGIEVTATVTATQRTGVEMEALTACAFAALCIVDSLRKNDPTARIDGLEVLKKEAESPASGDASWKTPIRSRLANAATERRTTCDVLRGAPEVSTSDY